MRLAACWMFREYVHKFAGQVARRAVEKYSMVDCISLLIRAPSRERQLRKLSALAVLWCRILMQLSDAFFAGAVSPLSPREVVVQRMPRLRHMLATLTSSSVSMLMLEIEAEGLDRILKPSRLSCVDHHGRMTIHM
jgi:hypothetical protein